MTTQGRIVDTGDHCPRCGAPLQALEYAQTTDEDEDDQVLEWTVQNRFCTAGCALAVNDGAEKSR